MHGFLTLWAALGLLASAAAEGFDGRQADTAWKEQHDQLVQRLRQIAPKAGSFGPAYAPLYKALIPWYEAWGGRNNAPVDDWAVAPETYVGELLDALEHGRNYIADNPASSFPLWFEKVLSNGVTVRANYQLHLPAGFPQPGHKYPLAIGLHGSGWIAHKISYGRGTSNTDSWISVTPILEEGDWQIDFLNAYLDELIRILPVDEDRVYLSGHSLGAIATWKWAMSNPERFAAIAPEDGFGWPYRAVRVKHIPVWAIHGEKDDVILPGFAEQMVSAVRAAGGSAKISILKGAPHNIPSWFDGKQITTWYLEHKRSHEPPPPDPRDRLGLDSSGFSKWSELQEPAGLFWVSEPLNTLSTSSWDGSVKEAQMKLFAEFESRHQLVDGPVRHEVDRVNHTSRLYLAVPPALQAAVESDPAVRRLPARRFVKFYSVHGLDNALLHLDQIRSTLKSGQTLSQMIWMTPLGPAKNNSESEIVEFWCELNHAK
jgi:pimeloyl-ACP methyl ester carboxylesterase